LDQNPCFHVCLNVCCKQQQITQAENLLQGFFSDAIIQTLENQAKMMDCCAFSYFSLFLPTRKKKHKQNLKLIRNRLKELTNGPHCIDPGPFRIDRDPMFRSSPRILPPLVAILAPTWRYIVENLPKTEP
jgi:hypothetical protein